MQTARSADGLLRAYHSQWWADLQLVVRLVQVMAEKKAELKAQKGKRQAKGKKSEL